MVLHRDIYWLGRQWCVTGYGVQATDSKWRMAFDVPVERLWHGDLIRAVETESWFDRADFMTALEIARQRSLTEPQSFQVSASDEK